MIIVSNDTQKSYLLVPLAKYLIMKGASIQKQDDLYISKL